eukprot:2006268-Prymnesium_polylepis.1
MNHWTRGHAHEPPAPHTRRRRLCRLAQRSPPSGRPSLWRRTVHARRLRHAVHRPLGRSARRS